MRRFGNGGGFKTLTPFSGRCRIQNPSRVALAAGAPRTARAESTSDRRITLRGTRLKHMERDPTSPMGRDGLPSRPMAPPSARPRSRGHREWPNERRHHDRDKRWHRDLGEGRLHGRVEQRQHDLGERHHGVGERRHHGLRERRHRGVALSLSAPRVRPTQRFVGASRRPKRLYAHSARTPRAGSCGRSAQTSSGGLVKSMARHRVRGRAALVTMSPLTCVARRNRWCERASARERQRRAAGAVLQWSAQPASWLASMAMKSASRERAVAHAPRRGRKAIAVGHAHKEGVRKVES